MAQNAARPKRIVWERMKVQWGRGVRYRYQYRYLGVFGIHSQESQGAMWQPNIKKVRQQSEWVSWSPGEVNVLWKCEEECGMRTEGETFTKQ